MLTIFGIVSGGLVVTETFPVAIFSKLEKLLGGPMAKEQPHLASKELLLKLPLFKENVILKCGVAGLVL